jgi:hypothetical protein
MKKYKNKYHVIDNRNRHGYCVFGDNNIFN